MVKDVTSFENWATIPRCIQKALISGNGRRPFGHRLSNQAARCFRLT